MPSWTMSPWNPGFQKSRSALPGLGCGVRDREASSVVGLCVQADPKF